MQFSPELVRLIATSKKTQTRRPIRSDRPCTYKPGKTYAVQPGRGKPSAFRIIVTDVRQEPAGALSLEDARAEGFRTTADFAAYWVRLHDKAWIAAEERGEHEILVRFTAKHARKPVWVITFALDQTHTPRLLAARPAPDYTTSLHLALPGEPEALSEADYERHVERRRGRTAEQWQTAEQHQRDLDRMLMSREQRIARLHRDAQLRGIDVSREMWLLKRRLSTLTGQSLERHIQGVETKVYRLAA